MPTLSLFDVVGPVMIGPSSSHTAGAARIGWLVRAIVGGTPGRITLRFRDSLMNTYSGHATDRGLVAGLLGYREDSPSIRKSLEEACAKGIPVSVERIEHPGHPNEMECRVVTRDGVEWDVSGISIGGGSVRMTHVNGVPVSIDGSSGGYLVRHISPRLPDEAIAVLSRHGFWTDLTQTTAEPGVNCKNPGSEQSCSGALSPCYALSFIPGSAPMDSAHAERLADIVVAHSADGFVRWVPAIYENRRNPDDRVPLFTTGAQAIELTQSGVSLSDVCVRYEVGLTGLGHDEVWAVMKKQAEVMKESMARGLNEPLTMVGGFTSGEDGKRVWKRAASGGHLGGHVFASSIARALAVAEVNGSMGRIVAAPTAGASGTLPAVVFSVAERMEATENDIVGSLLVAAGVGAVIGRTASFSGAVGGCQAEIGIASAIAAAGATHLSGGSAHQVFNASALALKNILGLACDPAAGPVEVPCIKRNAIGVANALAAAEMSLAGVVSAVPFDDVVLALKSVQDILPEDLRDNTLGGLGSTPTSARMKRIWAEKCRHGCIYGSRRD